MVEIVPFEEGHRAALLDLAIRAWEPVFPLVEAAVSGFVYDAFYPDGWRARQRADLEQVLTDEAENVDVAIADSVPVGWVCTKIHPDDSMSEVYVIAVDPARQREGIARALLDRSFQRGREADMRMVMVETGDDPGHAAARAAYENVGFERWPVARYFKDLST